MQILKKNFFRKLNLNNEDFQELRLLFLFHTVSALWQFTPQVFWKKL